MISIQQKPSPLHLAKVEVAQLRRELQLVRLRNKELEEQAGLDPLTQIANRGTFDRFLSREWLRAMRDGHPISILMIDIDHFKRFNDTHGHIEGDRLLKRLAKAWSSVPERACDLVARYGGEEFAVILPGTTSRGGRKVARDILAVTRRIIDPMGQSLTCSIGVAACVPIKEIQPKSLVSLADQRLYRAKAKGRDRVWAN